MKKAFHPCLWIAITALVIMICIFMFRNISCDVSKNSDVSVATSSAPHIRKININTADASMLQQIPGIGPALADTIISHRDTIGGFHDPAQLLDIPGIGEKKLITLLDYVYLEE